MRSLWHQSTVALVAGLLLIVTSTARGQTPSQKKPNVLFIVVDDLNTGLGCYGHSVVKSPHIDALAQDSVRFERAYCQFPLCNPSRTSFLSGRRPETTKVTNNRTNPRTTLGNIDMLPEHFRKHGYFTARIGKVAHDFYEDALKWDVSENPINRQGKDLYSEGYGGERTTGGNFYVKLQWKASDRSDEDEPDGCIAHRVVELMEQHKDKPFFLAAGLYKPHLPFVAPKKYFEMYPPEKIALPSEAPDQLKAIPAIALTHASGDSAMTNAERRQAIAAYYACTTFMDAQVGKLLAALDRLKLADRTIVVLVSDHGFHLGDHAGLWRKMTLFEEAIRVPLIVRAPGRKRGGVSPRPVELVDLYPTLVDLAALPLPDGLEGTSLVPLLDTPDRAWKKAAFSLVTRNVGNSDEPVFGRSVRTERYRLNDWANAKDLELYDLHNDPKELTNLAVNPQHADALAECKQLLADGWKAALPSSK